LHRYTGERDIVVGSPVANRQTIDVERLIGVVVNTLAMRARIEGDDTFRELLRRVRTTVLGAYEHQELPFEMLVDAVGAAARNDATPLFQAMFAFQNLPRWSWEAPGLAVEAWNVGNGCAKFDLTLFAWEGVAGIGGLLEYDADLYDEATVSQWLRDFGALLETIGRDPDCAIATLPIDGVRRHGVRGIPGRGDDRFDARAVDAETLQAEAMLDASARSAPYASPRDARERMIVDAFEQVLERRSIGIDEDFFDAGGDSFSALRLIELLESDLAVDIPLVTLYEHPTAAKLAVALARLDAQRFEALTLRRGSSLVEIKRGRAEPALFLVPGGHGGMPEMTLYARALSRLRRDLQVYGILARGIDGNEPPHSSVAAMAEAYIAHIRRIQPRGPYALAGECVGGLIAFEMAQQLFAQHEPVALLVLLDTWCPTLAGAIHYRYVERAATLFAARRAVARRGLAEAAQVLRDHVRDRPPFAPLISLRYAVNVARTLVRVGCPWLSAVNAVGKPAPGRERIFAAEANYIERTMRYRPRPYPGRVTLIVSAANARQGLANPWRALALGGLVVLPVRGDHDSYLREIPESTMPALEACIDEHLGTAMETDSHSEPTHG
jgi:thioesterase domain-containing protein